MQVLICSPVSRFAYQVDNLKGEPTLRGLLSALPATAAVVDVAGIVYSDNVLQTDMVVPAGWGVLYPRNLNERGDLRGHPSKQKPPLKKPGLSGARAVMRQKPPSDISFTFPSKAPDFRLPGCNGNWLPRNRPLVE